MIPYLCQRCSHYTATTHVTVMTSGVPLEYHICEACEKAQGKRSVMTCPKCGLGFEDIQRLGRFGCAEDYEVFRHEIAAAVQGYHGSAFHVGKNPSKK